MDQDESWLQEGLARFEQGDLAGAEALLRRIGVSSYLCRDALLALSRVLSAAGQHAEALRCAEEADNLDRDAGSCYQLGACKLALNDLAGAKAAFEQALARDPSFVDAFLMLGHVLRGLGQPAAAITAYEEALRLDDAHAAARYYLAEVLLETRDLMRASTQLHYLLKLQPGYAPAIALVGDISYFNQDYRQAVVEYVRAHALGEGGAPMLHRLGQAFLAIQDPFQACKAFDRAIKADRAHWDSHLAAAQLCETQGWFNRATRYFQALSYVPAHRTEAYKGLARAEAGVARSGLQGIDPQGAPEDTYDYLEGPFTVPEVLAAAPDAPAAPRPGTAPIDTRAGRGGSDAYGVGAQAASYLADFVEQPAAQRPAPRPAQKVNTGMLESLQQKLRDKLNGQS